MRRCRSLRRCVRTTSGYSASSSLRISAAQARVTVTLSPPATFRNEQLYVRAKLQMAPDLPSAKLVPMLSGIHSALQLAPHKLHFIAEIPMVSGELQEPERRVLRAICRFDEENFFGAGLSGWECISRLGYCWSFNDSRPGFRLNCRHISPHRPPTRHRPAIQRDIRDTSPPRLRTRPPLDPENATFFTILNESKDASRQPLASGRVPTRTLQIFTLVALPW